MTGFCDYICLVVDFTAFATPATRNCASPFFTLGRYNTIGLRGKCNMIGSRVNVPRTFVNPGAPHLGGTDDDGLT